MLLVLLVLSVSVYAEDFSGVESTPLAARPMGDGLVFSVVALPPDNALHWRIVRDISNGKLDRESITSGETARAGERYAYYWDAANSVLWFATRRSIMKLELAKWDSTKCLYRGTAGYEDFTDLPEPLQRNIPQVLK